MARTINIAAKNKKSKYGLLGLKLGHSYSPEIHGMLADYDYELFEVAENDVETFIKEGNWKAINVTVPYKKIAAKLCDELSKPARKTGSVNTMVRLGDGTIFGDNTDIYGFEELLRHSKINVQGKKVLVLGSGGASAAICYALNEGCANVVVISRNGENNYENLDLHADASVIVNATPVGMYPNNGISPIDLTLFPSLEAVFDAIYNPARTSLLLQAEELDIPAFNGLRMLVGQAVRACEIFMRSVAEDETENKMKNEGINQISEITDKISKEMQNIAIIGMPGCGKTTVAKMLGQKLKREVIDTDEMINKNCGATSAELITKQGEAYFRNCESSQIAQVGKLSGKIIATGGGCVTVEENYKSLHQNSIIVWIRRDVSLLANAGRPLSQNGSLDLMYEERKPLYEKFADIVVDNNKTPQETVKQIEKMMQ